MMLLRLAGLSLEQRRQSTRDRITLTKTWCIQKLLKELHRVSVKQIDDDDDDDAMHFQRLFDLTATNRLLPRNVFY